MSDNKEEIIFENNSTHQINNNRLNLIHINDKLSNQKPINNIEEIFDNPDRNVIELKELIERRRSRESKESIERDNFDIDEKRRRLSSLSTPFILGV